MVILLSGPCGNRTRLSGLRGQRPIPIDERAVMFQCDEQELNLQILKGWLGYGQLGLPMPNRRALFRWHRRESNPQSPRFELGRFAGLRTAPCSWQAPATGFGPRAPPRSGGRSCVTGRRALQAAPRGHVHVPVAQVVVEPGTAAQRWSSSLVLSQGGLPVAYRAACAQSGSRTRKRSGLGRAALPGWRTWAKVVLGGL